MSELTWQTLEMTVRVPHHALEPTSVPDGPGVYVWWRDGEPYYVDAARRLRVRLTRIDTHAAGRSRSRSTLRGRVRLLLRARGELNDVAAADRSVSAAAVKPSTDVDRWLADCEVSWVEVLSYGYAVEAVDRLLGHRLPELHVWRPRPGEDDWLVAYLDRLGGTDAAGRVYAEVPIGGPARYGPGAKTRYVDAVRLPDVRPGGIRYYRPSEFESDVAGRPVEIIEVKKSLNRTVIGQLLVADDLARADWPDHGPRRLVALCTTGDPALEWICDQRGIDLELVEPNLGRQTTGDVS